MKKIGLKLSLRKCIENQTALMAFNIQNVEQLRALTDASLQLELPAIAQLSAKYAELEGQTGVLPLYRKFADQGHVYLHLDHCIDQGTIVNCILQGFDSVMFDGSSLPLRENIDRTNQIKSIADAYGCLVEAELGHIGGVEDGFGEKGTGQIFEKDDFAEFCERAEADLIAPAIGNAHGFYRTLNEVQIELFAEARLALKESQFLVLHGGTGLPDEAIRQAIKHGVVKINISTDLKFHTRKYLLEILEKEPLFDRGVTTRYLQERLSKFYISYISKYST